jgi:hypothetical protein
MSQGLIEKAAGLTPEKQGGGFDQNKEIEKMVSVMPAETKKAFTQIVKAGQTIMYSPETREEIMSFLATDAPVEERLGSGIANLVIMIDNKANGALPKEAMIPAATVLLFDAADILRQSGETISVEQMGSAYEMMFYGIFSGYGMEPDQVDATFDGIESELGGQQQQQATPAPGGV